MKHPNLAKVVLATSLTLAFAFTLVSESRAEMVSQVVDEEMITPEATPMQTQPVAIREAALPQEPIAVQAAPVQVAPVQVQQTQVQQTQLQQTQVTAAPAAAPQTMGSTLDQGVTHKMKEVQGQFESALLRTLDRIKVSVDDGNAQAPAAAPVAPVAPVVSAEQSQAASLALASPNSEVKTVIVKDSVVNATAAPANFIKAIDEEEASSVAKRDESEEPSVLTRVRLSPVFGIIGISSDIVRIDPRYAAGLALEFDVTENVAATFSYVYAQHNISSYSLGSGYGAGYEIPQLQYNQNLIEGGGRFYLMPRESAFRVFIGGGLGLNKGYINYRNAGLYGAGAGYGGGYGNAGLPGDYELNSWIGSVEGGGEFRVSNNVSIGGTFKYSTMLSSRETGNYFQSLTNEQLQAGALLTDSGFYSILGTVKVGF